MADEIRNTVDRSWENGYEQAESEFVQVGFTKPNRRWVHQHPMDGDHDACEAVFVRVGKRAF